MLRSLLIKIKNLSRTDLSARVLLFIFIILFILNPQAQAASFNAQNIFAENLNTSSSLASEKIFAASFNANNLNNYDEFSARKKSKAKRQTRKSSSKRNNNKLTSEDIKIINSIDDKELRREVAIGRRALKQIEESWPLTSDPIVEARLTMILNRLEPHMTRRIPYEIRLIKTDVKNAFCLPGGLIFFTTGILNLLKTDAELAAVMAHEMIHADRKHSLRMAAESNKVTLGALAVMLLSQGAAVPIILAQVAQIAIMNSYTIELETEADSLGLDALIDSGYPPGGMVTLMEKFLNEEMKEPVREYGIYMNHPESPKRLASALNKLNSLNIPVNRKLPLGLLRINVKEQGGKVNLLIDGENIFSADNTPENLESFNNLKINLDKHLQLELAPYDLHTANNALYIRNSKIYTGDDAEILKQNLLSCIDRTRRKHTAKYFK
ncbi:MAG: M48 family metalloprotease [Synergistaceae bacterium]|nr:M48 family metalloprotease [Synergistaceae bacterium]MBR0095861.1 M48 family metalloprotease [Synergistaceae bacterium]